MQFRFVCSVISSDKLTLRQLICVYKYRSHWGMHISNYACSLLRWLFYNPEDGGDTFLRNVGYHSTHYTASYPRRRYSSTYILSRVCGDYVRRVLDWQLDLLDHTQLQCMHSYSSLQFTITLAESSHCIFTGCLSSNIAGSDRLQLCNSSLKTAARPEH
jgi:hypothetical protein